MALELNRLERLNRQFDEVWQQTDDIPQRLAQWQTDVAEFLAHLEPDAKALVRLEQAMDRWQQVMETNREILEQHQETLKQDLRQGEPSAHKATVSKKYKK